MNFSEFTTKVEHIQKNRSIPTISNNKTVEWSDFSKEEGFTPITFMSDPNTINKNIATIQSIQTDIKNTNTALLKNYPILSSAVDVNESTRKHLHNNNSKYHYDDTQDPNVIIHPEESKDIKTAIQQDIQQLKLYQNSIYITAVIAGATFLIATIILVKK